MSWVHSPKAEFMRHVHTYHRSIMQYQASMSCHTTLQDRWTTGLHHKLISAYAGYNTLRVSDVQESRPSGPETQSFRHPPFIELINRRGSIFQGRYRISLCGQGTCGDVCNMTFGFRGRLEQGVEELWFGAEKDEQRARRSTLLQIADASFQMRYNLEHGPAWRDISRLWPEFCHFSCSTSGPRQQRARDVSVALRKMVK